MYLSHATTIIQAHIVGCYTQGHADLHQQALLHGRARVSTNKQVQAIEICSEGAKAMLRAYHPCPPHTVLPHKQNPFCTTTTTPSLPGGADSLAPPY